MTMWLRKCALLALALFLVAACGGSSSSSSGKKLVYLSMSYIGNDWQPESKNLITALAQVSPLSNDMDLRVTVAGTSVERQIAQINGAVQVGAKGILIYPISPTALNATIKRACDAGVKIMTYDSIVTEPCAYGVTIHQHYAGQVTAQWLAEKLHSQGNIVMITGVAGTSVDQYRTEAAKAVFAKYPGIHIIAEAPGDWAQAPAKAAMANILVSHPASQINGVWAQVGCYAVTQLYQERNLPILPCAGEQVDGHLNYMLPPPDGVSLPSISYSATNFTGALGLRLLDDLINGKSVPHVTYVEFRLISNDPQAGVTTIPLKVCHQGTPSELVSGCSVFAADLGVAPGFFDGIWSPFVGLGLNAALTGSLSPAETKSAQDALKQSVTSFKPDLGP